MLISERFLPNDTGLFFCHDEILLHKSTHQFIIPLQQLMTAEFLDDLMTASYEFDVINNCKLHAVEIAPYIKEKDLYYFLPVRQLLETLEPQLFNLVCRAKQLLNWHKLSRFCGTCGHLTQLSQTEVAKFCQNCQAVHYPYCAPAIIVLIERGDDILLARSPHFTKDVYSTLAGYISVGETAEQAVIREVKEEVGITINNIQYFGSQTWPFPHSFMLGYTAHYADGEICISYDELEDARWFNISALPPLPSPASIARHLIDVVVKKKQDAND